jgi:Aspartyl/Asparaginyl beta-hydroxylase
MRPLNNFSKVAEGLDIQPILNEINANGNKWQKRQISIKPWQNGYTHREIEMIALRLTPTPADAMDNDESYRKGTDEIIADDLPVYDCYPKTREMVYQIMGMVRGGIIGRVGLIKLPPDCYVYGHYDTGLSSEFYNRFHVMVNGDKGNWAHCGEGDDEEHLEMLTGECWTFNHQKWHSFSNRSNSDRIYLNIDIR